MTYTSHLTRHSRKLRDAPKLLRNESSSSVLVPNASVKSDNLVRNNQHDYLPGNINGGSTGGILSVSSNRMRIGNNSISRNAFSSSQLRFCYKFSSSSTSRDRNAISLSYND